MVNWEYYKVFYYVAATGSVSEAARQLNLSQPAVSQSIKNLERALSTKLFTRASRGVELTGEGEMLKSYVVKSFEQLSLGEEKIEQMRNLEAGEITIGASDMTLQYYLLPYLERFHEQYPGIKINVTNAPTPETIRNLEEGKIDFGVISSPFAKEPFMETLEVREIEDIFVAARRYIGIKNKMLDLSDLKEYPLIILEKNTSSRSYIDDFMRENGVELTPEFELATSDMIVQFALRNLGIGCVVREFAEPFLESGKLFELRFNTIIPRRHFCVARAKNNLMSTAAANLFRMLAADVHP